MVRGAHLTAVFVSHWFMLACYGNMAAAANKKYLCFNSSKTFGQPAVETV